MKVQKLVAPLRNDSKSIFEEGNDDQETTNGGQVTIEQC